MSELRVEFEKAAHEAQNLPQRPDNDILLKLYALYKQAVKGDVTGKRPGMFDMVARAKFDAWGALKGTSSATAMQEYINLVNKLKTD